LSCARTILRSFSPHVMQATFRVMRRCYLTGRRHLTRALDPQQNAGNAVTRRSFAYWPRRDLATLLECCVRDHYYKSGAVTQQTLLWINVEGTRGDDRAYEPFWRLFRVAEISDSELQSVQVESCDALCFNFDFPSISGLKLIPEAKKRWPSAPILMLTQQSSSELAVWALRSRVFDLLVKPVGTEEVKRVLERVTHAVIARRSQTERRPQVTAAQLPLEARYRPQVPIAPRLQAAIAHVAKHYLRPIPESEVALLCNMSPSRFCRQFKAAFDVTFVEYLANYRMQQAKRLLSNPAMPVADVAAAVGFNDPSYFTRVFRKQEGVSPSEYRAASMFEATRLRGSAGA
jgi:AraC-like DNA-binding protein